MTQLTHTPFNAGIQNNTSPHIEEDDPKALRRAAAASFIGNFVEWFDYAAYGYLATIIAAVFFPSSDITAGLLATFAVFAMSFIIRPIGGIIWGYIGDRVGRKNALSLSILIMSGATFCIGFLPGYAQIGFLAPALLLLIRIVQGFSAAGEYAGAAAFLTEYAPSNKRGLYASIVPASTASGLLFGAFFVAGLHAWLNTEQLHSWGWRLPFLLAAPFGLIGRYIRLHLEDTPVFRRMEAQMAKKEQAQKLPIRELLTTYRHKVIIAFGVTCLNAVAFYMLLSYMPIYLSAELGMEATHAFLASTVSLASYIGLIFLMGHLSDKFGRKRMLIAASISFMLFSVPLFMLLDHTSFLTVLLIQIAFGALLTMNDGTLPCFLSEIFPTHIRYTGFAFSFNTANAIFGGTAPLIATSLISLTGSPLAPAWYLVGASALALIAMLKSKETAYSALK